MHKNILLEAYSNCIKSGKVALNLLVYLPT